MPQDNADSSQEQQRPTAKIKQRLDLKAPLVPLTGKPIELTDEEIYAGLEFP